MAVTKLIGCECDRKIFICCKMSKFKSSLEYIFIQISHIKVMNIFELMFLQFEDWFAFGFIEVQLICYMLKKNVEEE